MSISMFLKMEPYHPQTYQLHNFVDDSLGRVSPDNLTKSKGWETWKKYKHLFPSSNFVLLENCGREHVTIFMINKRAFLKAVEDNIGDFRDILGADETSQTILDRCLKSKCIFNDALKGHHGLAGILLGYGRHNSFLFSRREQISRGSELQMPLSPSPGFSTIDEEHRYINERLTRFDELGILDFNSLLITLPMLAADHDHPETQQLKVKYTQQYKDIIARYKKGDFLEITLSQLCMGF
jgi:hypothetical protein